MEAPVTREEAALLVLGYLEREWPATAAAYRAEAAGLLASLPPADGSVKPLQDVLNEYVQLESAARKRAEFECSFGESVAVRSFLSKLGKLLDDYVGLREGQHGPTPGAQELAAAATRGVRGEASACVSTTRRERKSSKPSRRAIGTGGPAVNSRRLFGRSSGDAAVGASSSCFEEASVELQPSACAGGKDALEEHLPLLSERIAQHINTLPDRAAGAGRSTGEMSIDDVMTALLSDPQSATALSSFVRSPPSMAPRQERPNSPIVSFSQSASRSDERVGSKRLISSLTCDEEDECVRPDAAALEATKQPQR
ncbi:hypothetical protein AB1Y20_013131 [Prymnesium parvum]|uniref:LisH domain-containing protein n=1 Tax=Prymnesium parvum TaxID=97485 RepID=A0AB34ILW3_PRYPA